MPDIRVGLGHDTHRLEEGRPLILGGIPIAHSRGAVAHSDGDVVLHALIDALLGATGQGDIGERFPDSDPQYRGANSAELLRQVLDELRPQGWQVGNADIVIFLERPKLSPHKPAIRDRIAELLGVSTSAINVKAKTGENVGPVGEERAVEAMVVLTLKR